MSKQPYIAAVQLWFPFIWEILPEQDIESTRGFIHADGEERGYYF